MSKRARSGQAGEVVIKVVPAIADIAAADWDACAVPDAAVANPFVKHAFLKSLEDAGCVDRRSGWVPQHLVLEDEAGKVAAVAPAYLKGHSQGEYVFDYGWADAYERAGGRYYPKLQLAVPFTPVPGRRLLVRPGEDCDEREAQLASGIAELTKRQGFSSAHITFLTEGEWQRLGALGFLQRTGKQYHFRNEGYRSFEDFLASLASRKRKTLRKERAEAVGAGIDIEWVTGGDLTEAHWDAFYQFYIETGSRKWGRPYLNRTFFSLLGERMADNCVLVMARRAGRYVAGALNLVGGDCIYGRYWGAIEHHDCLHFEVCYYQAIEYAIQRGLARVEAGAQGDHKLARGYSPVATYSAHFIPDPGFHRAVARFLVEERHHMEQERDMLAEYLPFRKGPPQPEQD